MSNVLVAFIFAFGVGGWVYNKTQKQTGGLTQKSLIVAGVCGAIAFIVFLTLASTVASKLQG